MTTLNTHDYENIETALKECVSIDDVCLSVIEDNKQFHTILKRTLEYKKLINKVQQVKEQYHGTNS